MSPDVGHEELDVGSVLQKATSKFPETEVLIGGMKIRSMVDTGAQISTVTELWFRLWFMEEMLEDVSSLSGSPVQKVLLFPYLGYIELDPRVLADIRKTQLLPVLCTLGLTLSMYCRLCFDQDFVLYDCQSGH